MVRDELWWWLMDERVCGDGKTGGKEGKEGGRRRKGRATKKGLHPVADVIGPERLAYAAFCAGDTADNNNKRRIYEG